MSINMVNLITVIPIFVFLLVLQIYMPKLVRKDIFFGIRIPEDEINNDELKGIYKGYVRNLRSGQVEIVAEGAKSDLESFVHYLRRGPELSRVTDVKIKEQHYNGRYHNFRIRY